MCVSERDRERKKEKQNGKEQSMYVCVYIFMLVGVNERPREILRERNIERIESLRCV